MKPEEIDRDLLKVSNLDLAEEKPKADADNAWVLEKTSFYQRRNISNSSHNPRPDELQTVNGPNLDFIDFLAVAQWRQIEMLPITWQKNLSSIGVGGTARVKQSIVNLDVSLAFKQLHLEKGTTSGRTAAFQTSINEVSVLGHSVIRRHPNIIRLEGICWDVAGNEAWPVLAFRKADHGNLKNFLFSDIGKSFDIEQRLQICSDVGSALMTMHAFRMYRRHLNLG